MLLVYSIRRSIFRLFTDECDEAADPGVSRSVTLMCESSQEMPEDQTVVTTVDTVTASDVVGVIGKLVIQHFQPRIMKLVRRDATGGVIGLV